MKLSQEETEDLRDMLAHDGMRALLKLAASLVQGEEERVLKYSLETQPSDGLVRLKLRAEGAGKLLRDLEAKLEAVRAKHKV